jgi:hypothetical protein
MAMAISASDVRGTALNAIVTAQQTLVTNAVAGSAQAVSAAQALKVAQDNLVQYFLTTGRLQSSLVLASSL